MLSESNPLVDIANVRRPLTVIVDGVAIDRAAIDARLSAIAERFARAR